MRLPRIIVACASLSILRVAGAETTELARVAEEAMSEAQAACRADGGALWGVSLCGPLLLVDPATRDVYANQPDKENQLRREGDIFRGKLPNEINIANTAADWAGVKWTMIMLPLPEEKTRRIALVAHEMWHRIQNELGFPASGAANNHLETRDGRYWLQLEWRALAAALISRDDKRRSSIADAALFRARRHQLFAGAAEQEREMELHEGLAEYTGVKLSGASDVADYVVSANLKRAPEAKTYVRSFAYATGPAYGVLLDDSGEWRKTLGPKEDLAQLLFRRVGLKLPEQVAAAAEEGARHYGGAELAKAEELREQNTRELIASYRARLIDGPVLTIPLRQMNMQFNPGNLVALETVGTVYPDIRIVDVWGILTVTHGGALMSADFARIAVPAPQTTGGSVIEGDGWKLELKAGWRIAADQRPGSFVLQPADR